MYTREQWAAYDQEARDLGLKIHIRDRAVRRQQRLASMKPVSTGLFSIVSESCLTSSFHQLTASLQAYVLRVSAPPVPRHHRSGVHDVVRQDGP